jgi:hypothetical protein
MIHDHVAMSPPGRKIPKWASSATRYRTKQMSHVISFGALTPTRAMKTLQALPRLGTVSNSRRTEQPSAS